MANTSTINELNLRDIHLPDPVTWWPLAPGWWIIIGLFLATLAAFLIFRKIHQSRALNRAIIDELETIKNHFNMNNNQYELIQSLSVLMRRSCISFYPRQETASLTGNDWLLYLDKTLPDSASHTALPFHSGAGKILSKAPYMSETTDISIDANALINLCEKWISAQTSKSKNSRVN